MYIYMSLHKVFMWPNKQFNSQLYHNIQSKFPNYTKLLFQNAKLHIIISI